MTRQTTDKLLNTAQKIWKLEEQKRDIEKQLGALQEQLYVCPHGASVCAAFRNTENARQALWETHRTLCADVNEFLTFVHHIISAYTKQLSHNDKKKLQDAVGKLSNTLPNGQYSETDALLDTELVLQEAVRLLHAVTQTLPKQNELSEAHKALYDLVEEFIAENNEFLSKKGGKQ